LIFFESSGTGILGFETRKKQERLTFFIFQILSWGKNSSHLRFGKVVLNLDLCAPDGVPILVLKMGLMLRVSLWVSRTQRGHANWKSFEIKVANIDFYS
jgi:hypothetical protein